MNKIKDWLRIKLINYLGIDSLINLLDKHIDNNDNAFKGLEKLTYELNNNTRKDVKNDILHFQRAIDVLHRTVENVVHIGTDVYQDTHGHSWAIVCIEGNMNIIKFVDLNGKDARDVMHFLKQFEAGRHCIDTPYKQMFYDGFFKF